MNLKEAEELAYSLMRQWGLLDAGWRLQWFESIRVNGRCNDVRRIIALNHRYAATAPEHEIRNTILHEIAHALIGCKHKHNALWQRTARSIGCTGERCATNSEMLKGTYAAVCEVHGIVRPYNRVVAVHRKRCALCAGNIKLMLWHEAERKGYKPYVQQRRG